MRFGVCAERDKTALLAETGYDYIELSVAADLDPEGLDAADWAARRREIAALPLVCESFNSFVRTGKIVGPEADPDRLRRYVDTALERAAEVGGKIIVLGSGGARNVPEGYSRETARRQLLEFLTFCADASDKTGVVVVIEPLRSGESNVLNTVGDGAEYVRTLNRAGVRNLADTYHMEAENEPLDAITASRDVLAHVHTADTGRRAPGTGTYDHAALFQTLAAAGYQERVSIECSWDDFAAQIGPALAHLRRCQQSARAQRP